MLMFAILYFGIMIDSGLFDPVISRILKFVKGDPLKLLLAQQFYNYRFIRWGWNDNVYDYCFRNVPTI